jgi:hypothetical protein
MTVAETEVATLALFANRHSVDSAPRSMIRRALEDCQRIKQQLKSLGWYEG